MLSLLTDLKCVVYSVLTVWILLGLGVGGEEGTGSVLGGRAGSSLAWASLATQKQQQHHHIT